MIEKSISVPQTISDIQKRLAKPVISNIALGKMQSTTQIKNIIITREKRFKVITLKGKVIKLRIGRTKKFKRPIIVPTNKIELKVLSEVIPLIKYKDKAVPIMPERILDKKLRI